ncbi:DNA-3-methyladenine glycosylase II [Aspergillus chevalieri]|uniref:3-methyladenine DNA glycosylase n=1 Tax=Aspergillus chevalieri TaxID=182096 RepID=A0A7R7VI23_ASPCH|nr:3-methyladenine DNA glycosylase [Aspergillus chevalieri]BCR85120.1 3-methyladenine DNA glycosylase [Aspergillus chevalieri]
MMAVRRSVRLSAAPSSNPLSAIQQPKINRSQHSGIRKAQKRTAKAKKSQKAAAGQVLSAEALQVAEPTATPQAASAATTATDPNDNIFDPSLSTDSTRRIHANPPPLDRPVEPHRTNATLLTPHGYSLVAYPPGTEQASPSKTGRPRPTATTGTLLEKAVAHLIATDPRLKRVIEKHPCHLFSPEGLAEEVDPFRSLVSSIIGQQVSGAAAKSIRDKFVALFNSNETDVIARTKRFPTPEEIVQYDIVTLRTAGLSQRKAEYIQGLAQKFAAGELSAEMLLNASDQELMEKLTAVRGLGLWSVEMFACFALKRIDVFSTGDLGVQRGCAAFMGRDINKLKAKGGSGKFKYMPEKEMLELAAKFSPYRSLFMWYMWRVEGVDVAVLNA